MRLVFRIIPIIKAGFTRGRMRLLYDLLFAVEGGVGGDPQGRLPRFFDAPEGGHFVVGRRYG